MNDAALRKLASRASAASSPLSTLSAAAKNAALKAMAAAVAKHSKEILGANAKDVAAARRSGLAESMVARLRLDEAKLRKISESLVSIAGLPDPVGRELSRRRRPNGLVIRKVSVPIGVILIIYESRPNVTADCMALCLKSGNSVILKGGKEAIASNRALFSALNAAAVRAGVPAGAFEFVDTTDRAAVKSLLAMSDKIDLVIPRGGESLIRDVAENSKIPVIKHYKGVCHVFVDKKADLAKAVSIALNAKVQNPSVCNAMETLLVHEAAAKKFLPAAAAKLRESGVELRGDARTRELVPEALPASEEDWHAEYLDLILAVRVVKDLDEAVRHIRTYGSKHSDAIVTEDRRAAERFASEVDSACVFVNCSTRFNDGGEFGMGAEMGISTDKLHARGPMGLEELTTYKYVVTGNGQVRK
ncbi:MAG TPA: glutamate-5-semialdehyde dehydrogenase [Candidatus Eisenbacteria bacterium]|nr:glutamate-5-semialdehyde dehydrogenase [Candidatus Eisenbacteria bacterium]